MIGATKYFEVHNPYYAIIKAYNSNMAARTYVEMVANDEDGLLADDMREVERDYALATYSRAISDETGKLLSIAEMILAFNNEQNGVIIVTRDLC